MSTKSSANKGPAPAPALPAAAPWSLAARVAVSAVLLWHLTALLVGPFSLPPNLLNDYIHPFFRPYLGATYMDHSYKFFAPDPGPSHLIRYELDFADGSHREGVFPNLDEEWPRLFYHRHFMLSEFMNSLGGFGPPDPAMLERGGAMPEWTTMPLNDRQRQYARSYADHLLAKNHAASVTLYLREHEIPRPDQVVQGMKLTDPSLYRERSLGTFAGDP